MALAQLRHTATRFSASVCRNFGVRARPLAPITPRLSARTFATNTSRPAAKPVEAEPVLEDEEFDEFEDPIEEYPASVRRRLLALRDAQDKYDDVNREYHRELSLLQAKYLDKYGPLLDERKAIVTGAVEVGTYDVPDDGEPDEKCVPDFWLQALLNHHKVRPFITERDEEVLAHLVDIRYSVLTGEERGFKLHFDFKPNPFINNKTLEKTYVLEEEDEVIPRNFIGCTIDWASPDKDTTVETKRIKVESKEKGGKGKNAKGAKPTYTTKLVACESFFNFFNPPEMPDLSAVQDEEYLQDLQEELVADYDIGFAIKDQIIPRAVEWFTGEIAPPDDEDEYDEYSDEGYDSPEEEEPRRKQQQQQQGGKQQQQQGGRGQRY